MKKILIGSTGLVGKNLSDQMNFDAMANSSNISSYEGKYFDLAVVAAGDARKWFASSSPDIFSLSMQKLYKDISKIRINKIVLISTIDVLPDEEGDEDTEINPKKIKSSYGRFKYDFEELIKKNWDTQIIRLPGLFGRHLKKNILFDFLNKKTISPHNPSSDYQWLNLDNISEIVNFVLENGCKNFHPCSEPISVKELSVILGTDYFLDPDCPKFSYNMTSKYANIFKDNNSYCYNYENIINDLKIFSKK
ncbi:hypothetical protein N9M12_00450 [Gammaproteobacteria bacterium]|nr:hypothetical protein [Gammaproteobacteria bacterium]